jgi:orotidine-5'-phosphate decarboxylase
MDAATPDVCERLIVALDLPDRAAARKVVSGLGDAVAFYKVGLQLFTAAGPDAVRELVGAGKKVFLDLKLHEIPHSVAAAIHAAADLGVSMVTVHATGGRAMLQAAAQAAAAEPGLQVLAVTVVTSLTVADLRELGIRAGIGTHALRLALLAQSCGCHGVVCAPTEAHMLRGVLAPGQAIVTPGVRPAGSEAFDQARVASAGQARRAGASHVVVGRPITRASDPRAAALALLAELAEAAN